MPDKRGDNGQSDGANGKLNASQGRPTAQDMERLSTYLDGELDAVERVALERRLAQDATLRLALGELRQTRALLRALPTPAAPRSFALPEFGELDAPAHTQARGSANRDDGATGPLRTMPRVLVFHRDTGASRAIPRPAPTARVAQWLGTLVAVLGLALLLGATLPALAPSMSRAGSATSAAPAGEHAPSSATTNAPSNTAASAGPSGTFGSSTNQHAASPSADGAPTPTPTAPTPPTAPGSSTGDNSPSTLTLAQVWAPTLGVLLLIGGVILFAYGRFARPRR